jgi:hypothetical protein
MELFIPSLLLLIVCGIIAFAVVPKFTTPAILLVSMLIFVYVLYYHYTTFAYEYQYSTWQLQLTQYAPFLMIFALIGFIFMAFGFIFQSGGGNSSPISQLPLLPTSSSATNPVTGAINTGLRGASNVVSNASSAIKNIFTGKKNNSQSYNLTSLLSTPK